MYGYKPVLGLTDFPITNLVKNGDFSKGTTEWAPAYGTASAANNTLTLTGNGSDKTVYATTGFTVVYGHKCYVKAAMKVTNSDCVGISITGASAAIYAIEIANPTINTVYNLSGVAAHTEIYGQSIRIRHNYADATSSNGKAAEIQNVIFIDLTATFGAGNEPTAKEMDELMAYFPNSWFNGTVNLADYKWFMVYLLNQIRALKTAVVGIGGTV